MTEAALQYNGRLGFLRKGIVGGNKPSSHTSANNPAIGEIINSYEASLQKLDLLIQNSGTDIADHLRVAKREKVEEIEKLVKIGDYYYQNKGYLKAGLVSAAVTALAALDMVLAPYFSGGKIGFVYENGMWQFNSFYNLRYFPDCIILTGGGGVMTPLTLLQGSFSHFDKGDFERKLGKRSLTRENLEKLRNILTKYQVDSSQEISKA
jgi:hypothetical protein